MKQQLIARVGEIRSRREFLSCVASALWLGQVDTSREVALRIIRVSTRAEAEDIERRLKAGESFESLARQFSIDPTSRDGGYLGRTKLSALRPELRDALQQIRPGQVTDIIQTLIGYAILKVVTEAEQAQPQSKLVVPATGVQPAPFNYQTVTSVIGDIEEETFVKHFPKPPNYEQDLTVNCETRRRAIEAGIQELQDELAASASAATDDAAAGDRKMHTHYVLAQMFCYQGEMEKAIEHFQAAYDLAVAVGAKDFQSAFQKILGIAEMRRGESENCIHHHSVEMCLLPLGPKGRHMLPSGSEAAIQHYLKYLNQRPDDLEEKWLLNICYMTLGRYPAAVPKEHLVPQSTFGTQEGIGRFVDVMPTLGVDDFGTAGGVIIDDFDNDGFMDLVVTGMEPCQQLRYWHSNGDGTFTDRTSTAGLVGQLGGLNAIQTDYNNDGCMDIHVMRGGWSLPVRRSLLRNNGDGTFTDVTHDAGLASPATASQTGVWLDFDNDGRLDLFVGNENAPAQLFHNNGDGTFTDVGHEAGVDRVAFTKGVVAGDYDNDGYPDVYCSNYRGENFLYHNNGNGTFTEVARDLHVEKPIFSFPVWFFDYNNDGWLDLLVTSFIVSVAENIRSYLNLPTQAETLKLYKNKGGTFKDVTQDVGLDRVFMPMGANFGDVDNDGFLDFYLGTGSPSYASLIPNVLFRNKGGSRFVEITGSSGTGALQKGHGVAIGNFFNDGEPAIYSKLGGMAPGDRYYSGLFKSPGTGNNWIDIKLVGVKTNRAALGARIKLTLRDEGGRPRFIYRTVTSGGSFGASPLQQHIGIGKAMRVETMEIWWPTSRTRQFFQNVGVNQFVEIKEFAKAYSKLNRRAIRLA